MERNKIAIAVLGTLLVCALIAAIAGYWIYGQREIYYQDEISKSVKKVVYLGWIPLKEQLVWTPVGEKTSSPKWKSGLSYAFYRPIRTNEYVVVRSTNSSGLLLIEATSGESIQYAVWDGDKWHPCQSADGWIILENGKVRWSYRKPGEVFLYASEFIPELKAPGDVSFEMTIASNEEQAKAILNGGKQANWARYPWELR